MAEIRLHKPYNSAVLGHVLACVVGAASLIAGVKAGVSGLPLVIAFTLVIVGGMLPALAFYSWKFSRAAWSVMISTLCVFAAVTFFGSPKIANVLHVKILLALLIPLVQVVAVIMLADLRRDYREQ